MLVYPKDEAKVTSIVGQGWAAKAATGCVNRALGSMDFNIKGSRALSAGGVEAEDLVHVDTA